MLLIFFSKYAWVALLKHDKGIIVTNIFQKLLQESNRKPNKTWVGKDCEFCNKSFKSLLQDNDIEMYNDGKSVVAVVAQRTKFTNIRIQYSVS